MAIKKTALQKEEKKEAVEMTGVKTSVIFEAIRTEGEHELSRSFSALWWSGLIAGLAISTSVLATGFFVAILPDAPWARAVSSLGYPIGFLIVILGRMQLFTENTITPVLTLFSKPTWQNLLRTGRLWATVFAANMAGCLIAAAVLAHTHIVPAMQQEGILTLSRHYASATASQHLTWGIPAGFLIASVVWILPRMDAVGEVLVIFLLTYVIALGGLSHVVAGATELFIVMFRGELSLVQVVFGAILPAFLGNVIGGTGMFAAVTYAQVKDEF